MAEKPLYDGLKTGSKYDYKKANAGYANLAKGNKKVGQMLQTKVADRAETLKKATAMVQKPSSTKAKKPLYDVKAGASYDYKKANAGYKSLAEANMGKSKPKPKSKDEIAKMARQASKSTKPKASVKAPVKSSSGGSYRASKGDSLYSIAEKTLPKGKNLSSWFNALKKMNAGRKIFTGTGVSIPKGKAK